MMLIRRTLLTAALACLSAWGPACAAGNAGGTQAGDASAARPSGGESAAGAERGAPADAPLWTLSRRELDARLAGWQTEHPDLSGRVRAILLARLGTPYVLGCLGENAPPDTEPVFRLDQVDCTVLVLTSAAMAHARTLDEAVENMRSANYREVAGERPVRYETRLHFTEDRLDASPYFRNITAEVFPESMLTAVDVTLNRTASGGELLPVGWNRPMLLRYVATARLTPRFLAALPPVAGIAFVKTSLLPKGLAIAHEGALLDGATLLHASSESKKVVRVSLLEYLKKKDGTPRFDGAVFYEFR